MFFTHPDFSSQTVIVLLASEMAPCLQKAAGRRVVRSSQSKEKGSSLGASHRTGSSSSSQGVCLLTGRCLTRRKVSFLLWQNGQSFVSVFTLLCPQKFAAKNPHGCGRLSPLFHHMLCFSCSVVRIHRRGLQKTMAAVCNCTGSVVVVSPEKHARIWDFAEDSSGHSRCVRASFSPWGDKTAPPQWHWSVGSLWDRGGDEATGHSNNWSTFLHP